MQQKIILISGASGFIGQALKTFLSNNNYTIRTLVRCKNKITENSFYWDPDKNEIDTAALKDVFAVINLAGESIFAPWTKSKKQKILDSRVKSAKLLGDSINSLKTKPGVLISASGLHYYGSDYTEANENSPVGQCFLAKVCQQWEEAVSHSQIRTVNLRLGVVLDPSGGMLQKILPIFKLGLGGKTGNAQQILSWIALGDLLNIIKLILETDLQGPVNICSPKPVSNAEFVKSLAGHLNRSAFLPVPLAIIKLIFGREFVEDILLANQKAIPQKLLNYNFKFQAENIEAYWERRF